MYAIIRAGGKQAKVSSGDVIEVERIKDAGDTIEFQPLLVVDDDGETHSAPGALGKASVSAKVLGEVKGDKINMFKYKNKTGYSRRLGHRQTYTQIEITDISLGAKKAAAKKKAAPKKTAAKKAENDTAASETATSEEE